MTYFRIISVVFLALAASGCGLSNLAGNLDHAVKNHSDPATVRDAMPAYLLMMDALVEGDSNDEDKLLAAANLYGAYSNAFAGDPERQKLLSARALDYSERAVCEELSKLCPVLHRPFDQFEPVLAKYTDDDEFAFLYSYGSNLAGYIMANSGDWNAIAEVPKVRAVMEHIAAIDPKYNNGYVQLYLGVLGTLIPPSMGGKPDIARVHFERAITIAHRHDLMMQVFFAERYARMMFDEDLHRQLLNEVLAAPVDAPDLTLSNTLAKARARELLASAEDYF